MKSYISWQKCNENIPVENMYQKQHAKTQARFQCANVNAKCSCAKRKGLQTLMRSRITKCQQHMQL